MKRFNVIIIAGVLMFMWSFSPAYARDAKCIVAGKIARRAMKKIKTNKQEGIKLFIKAYELCPDNARINYNIGMAYFRYGNLRQAEKHLKKAVARQKNNGQLLNMLSWVMLENGSGKKEALEYARQAVKLRKDSPAFVDTLIRAYHVNGQLLKAALTSRKAKEKWPDNHQIASRYNSVMDDYIASQLKAFKDGKYDEAIEGLQKADFDPNAVNAYCWALFASGKSKQALVEAKKAQDKFSGEKNIKETFDQIMDRFIINKYKEFKNGKRSEAIVETDNMKQIYPKNEELKKAYDKMLEAVIAEADTISVPEPIAASRSKKNNGSQNADLLFQIQGGTRLPEKKEESLMVDVDRNIPEAKTSKPDGIAVIIGNKHYSRWGYGIPDVKFAARDAAYMKQYVVKTLGFKNDNIIYVPDATQAKLSRIFGTKSSCKGQLFNWVKPDKSDVFIYYVGHGAPGPEGNSAYIMPVDADATYITNSGYPVDLLYDNLTKIQAKRITVVMDTCFSGNSAAGMLLKNVSPAMLKPASPVRHIQNGIIFAGTGKGQVSNWYPEKSHSLFTYFFMKGLQGNADKNQDKRITVSELKSYLSEKVSYRARRFGMEQTPIIVGDGTRELARLK